MAALKCDICGGKLVMGTGGIATCDSCGMEHSTDRMKEKVQEIKGAVTVSNIAGVESLIRRGLLLLEDQHWKQATESFDKALEIAPENAEAHLGKLCADCYIANKTDLAKRSEPLDELPDYKMFLRFADAERRAEIEGYNQAIKDRIAVEQANIAERNRQEQEYLASRMPELKNIRERNAAFQGYVSIFSQRNECYALVRRAPDCVYSAGDSGEASLVGIYDWKNIASVSAGPSHAVGLRKDGTVTAYLYWVGYHKPQNTDMCNVEDWRDIIAIATGANCTIGLQADGRVITAGLESAIADIVTNWRDIVKIYAFGLNVVGIKADGAVVAAGRNIIDRDQALYASWGEIVAFAATDPLISSGCGHIGLKADGTVVGGTNSVRDELSGWRDIVAIDTSANYVAGLKADGSVVFAGKQIPDGVSLWRDMAAIFAGDHFFAGVKTDGTFVSIGSVRGVPPEAYEINDMYFYLEKRRKEHTQYILEKGKCVYCNGTLGGVFTKKCTSCGKPPGEHYFNSR